MVSAISPHARPPGVQAGDISSSGGKGEAYALTAADTLLKSTGQWRVWQHIRQQNDTRARTLAALILERNALLETAKKGETTDWRRFDTLTASLAGEGIRLWDHKALMASGWRPAAAPAPAMPLPPPAAVVPPPPPERARPSTPGGTDLLVLNLTWDHHTLASGLEAHGGPDRLFLPLSAMAGILELPIRVDAGSGRATGEVLGKSFELDLESRTLTLDGVKTSLPENAILPGTQQDGQDIHVDARVLKDWLSVDFDFNYREMSVNLLPRETLPFEERILRRRRWDRLSSRSSDTGPSLLDENSRSAPFTLPAMDLSLAASHNTRDTRATRAGYTLAGAGNLADANAHFFARGDETQGMRRLEARLEKTDQDVILPLSATRFALGDVPTPSLPMLARPGSEQGLFIENRPLHQERDFDQTRFEGNLAPGWEVELYRGNSLLNARTVGEDGRYLFDDVPLYYGVNDFRLVFYGPEGQRREERRRLDVGTDMLARGDLRYAASLTRQETLTYESLESRSADAGNARAVALMEYGLGERVTLSGGLSTDTREDKRRTLLHTGIETAFTGASLRVDGLQEMAGGASVKISAQTALGDTRIRASHALQDQLEGHDSTNPVKSISELSLFGALGKEKGFRVPYTLSGRYTDRENGHDARISLLNSLRTGPVYWTHSISRNEASDQEAGLQGSLNATARLQDFHLRGHIDYRFDAAEDGITQTEAILSRHIAPDLEAQAALRRDFADEDRTSLHAQLNWRRDSLSISPGISADSHGDWSVSLGMNMALGPDPHKGGLRPLPLNASRQGHAAVRVFESQALPGSSEKGERALEGVRIRAVQSGVSAMTDEDGIALLALPAHQKTDIVIEGESLDDPALFPLSPGEALTPRPGDVRALSLPVVRTGEIDGTLYAENAKGEAIPLRQTEVLLKNARGQVVDRVLSEYDGFYLFERVLPGEYTVEAAQEKNGEEIRQARDVRVTDSGSIESGLDFMLTSFPAVGTEGKAQVLFHDGRWDEGADIQARSGSRPVFEGEEALLYEKGQWLPGALGEAIPDLPQIRDGESLLFEAETPAFTPETPASETGPGYGVHAGSYRSREQALLGIAWARKRLPGLEHLRNARIQPVDLGEKGRWYRVVLGNFKKREEAGQIASVMAEKTGYGRVLTTGEAGESTVHLATFAHINEAEEGIRLLEKRFRPLFGQDLVLGIGEDATGYRIQVQGFKNPTTARNFRDAIAAQGGYARILEPS